LLDPSIWTAFTDFGLEPDLLSTGVCSICFFFYSILLTCARLS